MMTRSQVIKSSINHNIQMFCTIYNFTYFLILVGHQLCINEKKNNNSELVAYFIFVTQFLVKILRGGNRIIILCLVPLQNPKIKTVMKNRTNAFQESPPFARMDVCRKKYIIFVLEKILNINYTSNIFRICWENKSQEFATAPFF